MSIQHTFMPILGSRCRPAVVTSVLVLAVLACAGLPMQAAAGTSKVLTLYSGQHEQMVRLVVSAFEKKTGIRVKVRSGESPAMATAIIREGRDTRADVFFSENSPELVRLQQKGLLAPVAPETLKQIPARFNSVKGLWVGVLARQNVMVYNPKLIEQTDLPDTLAELVKPRYKGKVAVAPTDSDFLPLVRTIAVSDGHSRALAWLKKLGAGAKLYQDDEGVAAAVEHGDAAFGIINNYYYYRLRRAVGAAHMVSRLHHFAPGNIGNLVNVSGAAVLKYAPDPKLGQELLAFLVSKQVQTMLANSKVDFEYPLRRGVAANPALQPFSELAPPDITLHQLGTNRQSLHLLQRAGLL